MPSRPRIYADFNAIAYRQDGSSLADIPITGYGTLASLSNQRLRLAEGLEVVIFEPRDIECDGAAHFDLARTDPAGRQGEWVVVIDHSQTRDCAPDQPELSEHLCFGCRLNLKSHFKDIGRSYTEICPACGTSVMAPLAPPANAA